MARNQQTVYVKGDANVEVMNPEVRLGDVISMECVDRNILNHIKAEKIVSFPKGEYQRTVVSILKIIQKIHEKYPEVEVENLGSSDIIITYENQKTASKLVHVIKVITVLVITFFGSAFAIMSFSNDVGTADLFQQIYQLLSGEESNGFTILEVTYSIGLVIGILVFFNHFGAKKFTADPTPMEVEMRLYENDIQTTLVETYSRMEKEIDVE